ncbi:MAG: hypothetical protein ACLQFR_14685 [Streptosporangiaceae bacterium]
MQASVLAALAISLAAGCGAAQPSRATVGTCFAFGVRAIQQRLTVTRLPRACAGLSHEQVDQALGSAVRAAAGPLAKAAERQAAARDSKYLADLFTSIPPPRPEPVTAGSQQPASDGPLQLAALGSWLATAMVGGYLLASWVGAARHRRATPGTRPPAVLIIHAGLAIAGLGIWTAFLAAGAAVLAWLAVAVILVIAGLGMATLVTGLPDPRAAGPGRPAAQVLAAVLHGLLATLAILLVLLAAVGAG